MELIARVKLTIPDDDWAHLVNQAFYGEIAVRAEIAASINRNLKPIDNPPYNRRKAEFIEFEDIPSPQQLLR